jgi:hypothetical protein
MPLLHNYFLKTSFYLVSQRQWELLAFLPFSASVIQGGAGSPPPLVEVNQAILAWLFVFAKSRVGPRFISCL